MTQKFHDLVAGARSYRRFDQSKKMTMQELEELAELGLHHTMRWKSSVYPLCTLRR